MSQQHSSINCRQILSAAQRPQAAHREEGIPESRGDGQSAIADVGVCACAGRFTCPQAYAVEVNVSK